MKKVILGILLILIALPGVLGNIAYPPNPNYIPPEEKLLPLAGEVISFLILMGVALSITFLTEYLILTLFLRKKLPKKKIFLSALLINITTHPLAFFVLSWGYSRYWGLFTGVEILVFVIEGLLLYWLFKKKLKIKKATVCSFTANLLTASMSFLFLLF